MAGDLEVVGSEARDLELRVRNGVSEEVVKQRDGMRHDLAKNTAPSIVRPPRPACRAGSVVDSHELSKLLAPLEQRAKAGLEGQLVDGTQEKPALVRSPEHRLGLR